MVQIRAGGMGLRNFDEKIPYKYGCIGQETCGPGGLAYGIRSVPDMIELVLSIINNSYEPALVMTKNDGICPNLDPGMMLEATCLVGSEELQPLCVGEVPAFEKGLLENQYACEKLLVDAIFEHSDQKLLQAFTENRLVRDADVAKKIIADFKAANGEAWPTFGDA